MAIRSTKEALAWARGQVDSPDRNWRNICLIFTRSTYNVPRKYASAAEAYAHAKIKGTDTHPPAGAICWWTGGSQGFGHTALSAGDGWAYSNDFKRSGQIDKVRIADIAPKWGLNYRGYSWDVNDVQVYFPPRPVLDASKVKNAALNRTTVHNGKVLKRAVRKELGLAPLPVLTAKLGRRFRKRYRQVQVLFAADALTPGSSVIPDGIPGVRSLTWLGKRHNFEVEA